MIDPQMAPHRIASFRLRLILLGTAMLLLLAAVAWMAKRASDQSALVGERVQYVQRVGSWLGSRIRESVNALDTRMLMEKLGAESAGWEQAQDELAKLERWLEEQRPYLASPQERTLLDALQRELHEYAAAAKAFSADLPPSPPDANMAREVTELSLRSKALIELGSELAAAHQATADSMLAAGGGASNAMRWATNIALVAIVLIGGGMAWTVYRGSIAPMRRTLRNHRQQLARQEKLAALGELTTAISHEIRNPLTALKARIFTLRKAPLEAEFREDVEMIDREVSRLERIVSDFLRFARPPEPKRSAIDPHEILKRVQSLLEPSLEGIAIRLESGEAHCPPMWADPDQIEQALLNLVGNAAQAIADSGVGSEVRLRARAAAKRDSVRIEVEDDGPGVPPQAQQRLFDPYFTTKPNGTGLGLALTARIMEKHGGRVAFASRPGRATVFALIVPAASDDS